MGEGRLASQLCRGLREARSGHLTTWGLQPGSPAPRPAPPAATPAGSAAPGRVGIKLGAWSAHSRAGRRGGGGPLLHPASSGPSSLSRGGGQAGSPQASKVPVGASCCTVQGTGPTRSGAGHRAPGRLPCERAGRAREHARAVSACECAHGPVASVQGSVRACGAQLGERAHGAVVRVSVSVWGVPAGAHACTGRA